jgi:predicted Zn-dependent peptidase
VSQTILSHTFANGLVLVAQPMTSLQSAAFTFLVPAGCVYDPAAAGGLSSFACEMALRGAGERDSRQFVLDLDNLGVERSEAVFDSHTSYSGATLAENLPAALAIYADVLQRPHLPADQLEAARLVMFQELRAVDDEPSQKAMIELRRRYYPKPWGRPSQGDEEALAAIDDEAIRDFVDRHYRPNGTILGVAGRVDWEQLKDCVEQALGGWQPRPEQPIVAISAPVKYEHIDYSSNQTQVGIAYPTVPYRHPQYFTAWGAVGVLSGGMSARLFTEVRERRGLCYSVYASYHSLRELAGVFCYAGTSAERAQETLDVTVGELLRLAEGVESHEVVRLKARIKSSLIMQQESSSSRSSSLARDWYHLGYARTLEEVGRQIDALTSEGISAYLVENPPRDFTIVTLGPAELEVPVGVS